VKRAAPLAVLAVFLAACVSAREGTVPLAPSYRTAVAVWSPLDADTVGETWYTHNPITVRIRDDLGPDEARWVMRHEFLHVIGGRGHFRPGSGNILIPYLVTGDDTQPGNGDLYLIDSSRGTWTIYASDDAMLAAVLWACAYWNIHAGREMFRGLRGDPTCAGDRCAYGGVIGRRPIHPGAVPARGLAAYRCPTEGTPCRVSRIE